jgi:hypothetical protein
MFDLMCLVLACFGIMTDLIDDKKIYFEVLHLMIGCCRVKTSKKGKLCHRRAVRLFWSSNDAAHQTIIPKGIIKYESYVMMKTKVLEPLGKPVIDP